MKDYWLAKLISSVSEVDSRKRLQKAIYLLQVSGCPLKCDYILHYYGPYSFEVAGLIGQLNSAGIIQETPDRKGPDIVQYRSTITDHGRKALEDFEATDRGRGLCSEMKPFLKEFRELSEADLWVLELAATVAFCHSDDWDEARKQTAQFKQVPENDKTLRAAVDLARRFKQSA
jgi:uncharacterized protein YwgA